MHPLRALLGARQVAIRWLLRRWVRIRIKRPELAEALRRSDRPMCYVLEQSSQTDLAVLHDVCEQLRLPPPERPLGAGRLRLDRGYFELSRAPPLFGGRRHAPTPRLLRQLVDA